MAIQAIGGLMSIPRVMTPGGGPQKVPIVDILTGMYSAAGVISALPHRERTGEGQISTWHCWTSRSRFSPTKI